MSDKSPKMSVYELSFKLLPESKQLEVAECMFSSEKKLTQSPCSFTVMATCVRISNHSYNVLDQAVLFRPTAENSPAESTAPSALPLFAQEKALLVVQGNFWVEGKNCRCCKCYLKKNAKKFNQSRSWAVWPLPPEHCIILQPCCKVTHPLWHGRLEEAGGEKHTAAQPHLKQQGQRLC